MHINIDLEQRMSYEDFTSTFTRLEVCHLGLESLEHDQDLRGKRRLEESIFSGEWQKNVNAGGCINNRSKFSICRPWFSIIWKDLHTRSFCKNGAKFKLSMSSLNSSLNLLLPSIRSQSNLVYRNCLPANETCTSEPVLTYLNYKPVL